MDTSSIALAAARIRAALVLSAILASVTIVVLTAQGCRSAPVSGRKQLVIIPEAQEIQLGVEAYNEMLASERISENAEIVAMVERVGQRIAAVADKPDYDWEFRVIAKDVQNAFALPGGKVAVYEGILPVCESEAGIAVVMSHEIAHAIARHGGERMSQQTTVNGIGAVVNAVSKRNTSEATTGKIMQGYGLASEVGVILPYSRAHESEADAIGLILMAKAGYDPSVAPEFWERFSSSSGSKPPELLSTHPADARRAADLRALLPEAMKYYEAATEQIGMGDAIPVQTIAATETTPVEQEPTPIKQKATVQQASARLPWGPVSSLTGRQTVKKGTVKHALHETIEELDETSVQQAAAEAQSNDAQWNSEAVSNANFQLPIKSDAASSGSPVNPADWEASAGENSGAVDWAN